MNRARVIHPCAGLKKQPLPGGLGAEGGCGRARPVRAACILGAAATVVVLLAGCAGSPRAPTSSAEATPQPPSTWPATDGPPANPPPNLAMTPDAEPRIEPLRSSGPNKPYEVLGQRYTPQLDDEPFEQTGLASWYGRKFHGRRTASGEVYDMYAMTAAHRTLPIPSYALVRNPRNGREVVVRINDRGPFEQRMVIDLSYAAAVKLGVERGLAPVQLRRLTHDEIRTGRWREATTVAAAARDRTAAPTEAVPGAAAVPMPLPAPAALPVPPATSPATSPAAPATAAAAAAPTAATSADPPTSATSQAAAPATMPMAVALAPGSAIAQPAMPAPALAPPLTAATAVEPAPTAGAVTAAPAGDARDLSTVGSADPRNGFWLQFGAFSRREGAIGLKQQLMQELDWLAHALTVFDERNLWRVQAGPYASHAEALGAARRVRAAAGGVQPLILQRR